MTVFRIEREKYLTTTLTGIGASMTEGYRWNSLNTRMVYAAESRALATLEIAVHLNLAEDLPTDRNYVEIEIPNDIAIQEVLVDDLPTDWDVKPPNMFTQIIGDDFVYNNEAAILKVPSSVVPMEYNYLINPQHKDAIKIKVTKITKMSFDSRINVLIK